MTQMTVSIYTACKKYPHFLKLRVWLSWEWSAQ